MCSDCSPVLPVRPQSILGFAGVSLSLHKMLPAFPPSVDRSSWCYLSPSNNFGRPKAQQPLPLLLSKLQQPQRGGSRYRAASWGKCKLQYTVENLFSFLFVGCIFAIAYYQGRYNSENDARHSIRLSSSSITVIGAWHPSRSRGHLVI